MLPTFLLLAASLIATPPSTVAAMRDHKRVLLISAASDADPRLREQRHIVADWTAGAEDRDLAVVAIVGDRVSGAADGADTLRRRHRLSPRGFAVVLIGKDGGTKLRAARPIPAATLETTIDAMPMRRAGGR